ncbi:uncharacterized protein L3040_009421 [Drepanopeziza brunnea f. sp. 'multigermtubi']|uniref:C2H2 finger domain protein n=1 Tax=Marssonina brunnea f. sp. multigermtubi (strain MB_m1) TaxID=1072389 RepID=K1WJX3_MARBU|nr:C2H2 finger domain protein [Drepanopeziza brunnea f. sp. 'multigermtubi' MB_m1]EKD12527.1 C2H2 finger domain protein [Drepanopeziza brunnea f. sp. 'multigermtubi' MB_m1]KAJ5032830.1 hypothetical protein L3040_009421 [Drepanopeziza brunnea f. sp. 'multigermtubi']
MPDASSAITTGASPTTMQEKEIDYGCQTCLVHFSSKEEQRAHMKENWHIYNLKRRIASLPPISPSLFSTLNDARNEDGEKESQHPHDLFEQICAACQQTYTSRKAWQSHLKSRNHVLTVEDADSGLMAPRDAASEVAFDRAELLDVLDDAEVFDASKCLFCATVSPSLDANIGHMSHAHSFFIPDVEALIDIESFLEYLSRIISDFHECLYCGSERANRVAVQDHMRAKGHCRLEMEEDVLELREFYEFSRDSDEDEEEEGEEDGEVRIRGEQQDVTITISADEIRLPSGKILRHRSSQQQPRRQHSPSGLSTSPNHLPQTNPIPHFPFANPVLASNLTSASHSEPASRPQTTADRRIILKPGISTSLMGVSDQQQRALLATEKKMQTVDTRARKQYERKVERGGNRQKRFKVCSIGKKAGGLEKRNG